MEILGLLTWQLTNLLHNALPKLETNWWHSLVLEKLTYQQKAFAASLPEGVLERLDLAALLRVADQNWYDIANHRNLNREARNWLKEAQTLRNRWAHAPAEGLSDDMRYRDIDTLERLLQALGTDVETLAEINRQKKHLLSKMATAETPNLLTGVQNFPGSWGKRR